MPKKKELIFVLKTNYDRLRCDIEEARMVIFLKIVVLFFQYCAFPQIMDYLAFVTQKPFNTALLDIRKETLIPRSRGTSKGLGSVTNAISSHKVAMMKIIILHHQNSFL